MLRYLGVKYIIAGMAKLINAHVTSLTLVKLRCNYKPFVRLFLTPSKQCFVGTQCESSALYKD